MHVRCWAIVSKHLQIQKKHHSIHTGKLSQQAERGEALSSTKEDSHFKYEVGWFPKSTTPPKDSRALCLGTLGAWALLVPCGITHTPRSDLHSVAGNTGQLTRADNTV